MSKNWLDIAIAFTSGLIIAVLLMLVINKHISGKHPSINNNFYQFAVFNVSPIKEYKTNGQSKMSFAPDMAAQIMIDNNEPITFWDVIFLFAIWVLWLFFNKSVQRLIDALY